MIFILPWGKSQSPQYNNNQTRQSVLFMKYPEGILFNVFQIVNDVSRFKQDSSELCVYVSVCIWSQWKVFGDDD
jgi:hypothetical protein